MVSPMLSLIGGLCLMAGAAEPSPCPGPDQKGPAAERPHDTMLEKQIGALLAVLAHPEADGANLEQTRKAIAELVKIGPPAVPQLVRAILTEHPTASPYSALTLDEIGQPAVAAVRAEWEKLGEEQRWKLMRFRGQHDYEDALEFALASLNSKADIVRFQAIRYLGKYKEAKSRDTLLKMLNTDAPRLRWEVMDSLTEIGGNNVIDAFIKLLAPTSWAAKGEGLTPPRGRPSPWWPDGRPKVIEALRRLKAKDAAPALLQVLQEKGPGKAYLGSFIIPALAEFDYSDSIPELKRIIAAKPHELERSRKEPTEIQALAAQAIRQLGGKVD